MFTPSSRALNCVIRADAGARIGNGHVMRCLVLAEKLREGGHNVFFVMSSSEGNLADYVQKKGFAFALVADAKAGCDIWPESLQKCDADETRSAFAQHFVTADWIIVDHYQLSEPWHRCFVGVSGLFVIDDLANRPLLCNALLDQTFGRCADDYANVLLQPAQLLLGSEYCLLRQEFNVSSDFIMALRQQQMAAIAHLSNSWRVLVSLGGTDPDNLTCHILQVLMQVDTVSTITVVMGAHAPHMQAVKTLVAQDARAALIVAAENMAEIMQQHHIAVGAGGTSAWERCAMGLPSVLLVMADNQRYVAAALAKAGAVKIVESPFLTSNLLSALEYFQKAGNYCEAIEKNLAICDGWGAHRVVTSLIGD